jgi:hypothetical protein
MSDTEPQQPDQADEGGERDVEGRPDDRRDPGTGSEGTGSEGTGSEGTGSPGETLDDPVVAEPNEPA